MARKSRVHFPGALYHVIARGNQGQTTFRKTDDYRLYLKFLSEYKEAFGFLLYAYVLMPNHVHLLIQTVDVSLSKIMHRLQFRYTRNFNLKYRTWGHLFQGRYKAILCDRDAYLLELTAYIHLNPVRADLVKDPADYPWSSYSSYLGRERNPVADVDAVLGQFSERRDVARRRYDRFVRERVVQGHREDFYETRDQRFLGNDAYLEEVERQINEKIPFIYEMTLREIALRVGSTFKIPIDLLYSSTRARQGAWGRAVCAYLGSRLGGFRVREIAEHFNRDSAAIVYGMKRVEESLREDKSMRAKLTNLENRLIENKKRKIKT